MEISNTNRPFLTCFRYLLLLSPLIIIYFQSSSPCFFFCLSLYLLLSIQSVSLYLSVYHSLSFYVSQPLSQSVCLSVSLSLPFFLSLLPLTPRSLSNSLSSSPGKEGQGDEKREEDDGILRGRGIRTRSQESGMEKKVIKPVS